MDEQNFSVVDPEREQPEEDRRFFAIERRAKFLFRKLDDLDEETQRIQEQRNNAARALDLLIAEAERALDPENFFEIFGTYPADPGPDPKSPDCPNCGGIGTVPNPNDHSLMVRSYCPKCNANGHRIPSLGSQEGDDFAEAIADAEKRNSDLMVEGYIENGNDNGTEGN